MHHGTCVEVREQALGNQFLPSTLLRLDLSGCAFHALCTPGQLAVSSQAVLRLPPGSPQAQVCWDRRCEPLQLGFFFSSESDYQALLLSESSCCPLISPFPGPTLALYQKPFLKKLILLFLFVFQYVSSFEGLAMKLWLACNSGGSCLPLIPEHWCLKQA